MYDGTVTRKCLQLARRFARAPLGKAQLGAAVLSRHGSVEAGPARGLTLLQANTRCYALVFEDFSQDAADAGRASEGNREHGSKGQQTGRGWTFGTSVQVRPGASAIKWRPKSPKLPVSPCPDLDCLLFSVRNED